MSQVFVKVNANGCVTDVNSDAFLTDVSGWVNIDEGEGDRYALAQGTYLPSALRDAAGRYRYKLTDGAVVERTAEELGTDLSEEAPELTDVEKLRIRIAANEDATTAIMDLVMGGLM